MHHRWSLCNHLVRSEIKLFHIYKYRQSPIFFIAHYNNFSVTYCNFISTFKEPTANRKDLQALTLVGPPRDNLESDPLAVLHLDNWLFIYILRVMLNFKIWKIYINLICRWCQWMTCLWRKWKLKDINLTFWNENPSWSWFDIPPTSPPPPASSLV